MLCDCSTRKARLFFARNLTVADRVVVDPALIGSIPPNVRITRSGRTTTDSDHYAPNHRESGDRKLRRCELPLHAFKLHGPGAGGSWLDRALSGLVSDNRGLRSPTATCCIHKSGRTFTLLLASATVTAGCYFLGICLDSLQPLVPERAVVPSVDASVQLRSWNECTKRVRWLNGISLALRKGSRERHLRPSDLQAAGKMLSRTVRGSLSTA